MDQEKRFKLKTDTRHYMLVTSEYMGTKDFKFLIRSELRGDEKTTLFLLGVPNPAVVYAHGSHGTQEQTLTSLYESASNSIAEYINDHEWVEGAIYYGELMVDGIFHIGAEKPDWEDGNWGQKVDF